MPSPIDATELSSATFTAAVMRRILTNPDPAETGADRLRQIGLMVLIHNLQLRSIDATTSKIEEVSGTNRRGDVNSVGASVGGACGAPTSSPCGTVKCGTRFSRKSRCLIVLRTSD